jgi:pyruvate formate lyase activating enzyme
MPQYNPKKGFISFIQRYSTKDGPGIRSTIFLKGCPLNCVWCSNPELIHSNPDLLHNSEKCAHCRTCVTSCPLYAISFGDSCVISMDRYRCNSCGDCVTACPNGALELVGKWMSVDETVSELLKDKVFYQTSGGGVTFSGGEPLWQSGFVSRVARKLKENKIHTALDTAGDVEWNCFEEVLDYLDLILYDLKAVDRDLHRKLTGCENDLILMNLRKLAKCDFPLRIRMIVVPGLNDNHLDFLARMEIAKGLKSVQQVDILPYHRYGAGKYSRLGLNNPLKSLKEMDERKVKEFQDLAEGFGIPITIGG